MEECVFIGPKYLKMEYFLLQWYCIKIGKICVVSIIEVTGKLKGCGRCKYADSIYSK